MAMHAVVLEKKRLQYFNYPDNDFTFPLDLSQISLTR